MFRKFSLVLVVALAVLGAVATPSSASSRFFSKVTGLSVDAYWTQIDGTPVGSGPFGNVHVGYIYAYEMSDNYVDVFAYIDDFDCEEGQSPNFGHGEEGEDACVYMGSRYGYGENMELTLGGKKLESAHLSGSLVLSSGGGHGDEGAVVGNPAVDMTWTGVGEVAKGRYTYRYSEGGTSYSFSERSSYRPASVDGFIGAMTFDPDLSGGYLSQFSNTSKERTK